MKQPDRGEERAAALEALNDDQRKRLMAFARLRSRGSEFQDDDLFNTAVVRWLESDAPIADAAETCKYLLGAINSILFNSRRRGRTIEKHHGRRIVASEENDGNPVENVADPMASPDSMIVVQQLYDLCEDDEIRDLVMAQAGDEKPDSIKREFGWDDQKYDAVLKRKRRMVIRLVREGKLDEQ